MGTFYDKLTDVTEGRTEGMNSIRSIISEAFKEENAEKFYDFFSFGLEDGKYSADDNYFTFYIRISAKATEWKVYLAFTSDSKGVALVNGNEDCSMFSCSNIKPSMLEEYLADTLNKLPEIKVGMCEYIDDANRDYPNRLFPVLKFKVTIHNVLTEGE